MQQPHHPESLRPLLNEVEEKLKVHLDEICAANEVSDETTGELIRLEESLSMATESAKEVVTLRRKLREHGLSRERDTRAEGSREARG